MCFTITPQTKQLVAEEDIKCYKVGIIFKNGDFIPIFQTNFTYKKDKINERVEIISKHSLFSFTKSGVITFGYHSYKFLNDISTRIDHNSYDIGTFIIPKGTIYFDDFELELVSEQLIYKGKYIDNISTREEAFEAARNGEKITHRYFGRGEYLHKNKDGILETEDGYPVMDGSMFWKYRQGAEWQDGWSIYKETKNDEKI